jgi:hypothetical protein
MNISIWTGGFEPCEYTEQDREDLKEAIREVKRLRNQKANDEGIYYIEQDWGLDPEEPVGSK